MFVGGDHDKYAAASSEVMDLFRSITPVVEPLSLDEAFLDVRGALRLFGPPPTIAATIRRRVADELRLACSVGVAPNKFVAKLASEAAKPVVDRRGWRPGAGVRVVTAGEVEAFLAPLAVRALWGVGPQTATRLDRQGIRCVADLRRADPSVLAASLGEHAALHLQSLARGEDDREVETDRGVKSIGHEETFDRDHRDHESLGVELTRLADGVAARLRSAGVAARTVTLKVRFADFRTITRAITPPEPVDTGPVLARLCRELLADLDVAEGVRLIGVSGSGLTPGDVRQLSLDLDADRSSDWSDADRAVDQIRDRFGRDAIVPAAVAEPDGIRVTRRGAQQWGPPSPSGSRSGHEDPSH